MRVLLVLVVVITAGCSGHDTYKVSGTSLRELVRTEPQERLPTSERSFDSAEVRSLYAAAIARVTDRQQQRQVAVRVAEMTLLMATEEMTEQASSPMSNEAITQIESLLSDNASGYNSRLLYQLAQAKQLVGDRSGLVRSLTQLLDTQPDNLDARFRRAELRFTDGNFRGAAEDYAVVAAVENAYQRHANYMLGWSRFKLGDAELSLDPLLVVIEELASATGIAGAEKELLSDAMRVFQIALDYLDGPQSLAQILEHHFPEEKPVWQLQLYGGLANWYLGKRRIQDSVSTWETFLSHNPMDANAAQVTLDIMDTLATAGFVNDRRERELSFIEQFDRKSEFYAEHGEPVFALYRGPLKTFVSDATAHSHAYAQATEKAADYLLAANWYKRWLTNFPAAEEVADMQFLQAEALFDGKDFPGAVVVLDNYLTQDYLPQQLHQSSRRAASYKRVLAWQAILAGDDVPENNVAMVTAAVAFVREFPADPRSEAIHFDMMQRQYELGRFDEVTIEATWAMVVFAGGELGGRRQLLSAHAWFELGDYVQAEAGYRSALTQGEATEPELRERILICAFRQGEAAEQQQDWRTAITHYDRLLKIDPMSPVAVDAQIDVVQLYELAGDPAAAITQLDFFRTGWPDHPATKEIPMRLIALYETLNLPVAAARELLLVSNNPDQPEQVRQQAVYRAAELFLAGDHIDGAIDTFRRYAHNHPLPADLNFEAMHHMDLLYQQTKQPSKRRFWLKKKIARYAELTVETITARTRFLAADAELQLAQELKQQLASVPLARPVKRSLKKKQKLMKRTIAALEKVSQYGVADLNAAATYEMADSYAELARSLLDSDAPEGLSELESEQYVILLEEQAFPFEEKAIELHRINLERGWENEWNQWIVSSLTDLAMLSPGHYQRQEMEVASADITY